MIDAAWEELTRVYRSQAVEALSEGLAALRERELATKDLQEFRTMVHRLRGTGASFGFPWLTEACAEMDQRAAALLSEKRLPDASMVEGWTRTLETLVSRLQEARLQDPEAGPS